MLSIGIVDVTTVGSTICQRRLIELAGIEGDHPEFVVHSLPFKQYITALETKDWKQMGTLISQSISKLEQLNVSFIIIPSNTPHYAYNKFAAQAKVPVLNLLEITAEACQLAGLKRVAILGTLFTANGGLYKDKIEQRGMQLVIPDLNTCMAIQSFIMDEIIPNKVNQVTRQSVLKLIKQIDCDGFILGCTELPEVYSSSDLKKPAIDTTRLIAEVAFEIAKQNNLEKLKRYI